MSQKLQEKYLLILYSLFNFLKNTFGNKKSLLTRTVLVTGAGQGIGRAIATALASKDRTLFLADLNRPNLEEVQKELESKCKEVKIFVGDLTKESVRKKMVRSILENYGSLDVLVNNAGVTHKPMSFEELTDQDFDFNFSVNTRLPFQLIRDFLPTMKASNNGVIVNMSSAANISGYEDLSVYSASKAALSSLTDSVAKETKDLNIKAVAIMPSRTNTPMQVAVRGKEVAKSSQSPDFVAGIIAKIVDGDIDVKNGDDVRIREGRFVVEEDVFTKKI